MRQLMKLLAVPVLLFSTCAIAADSSYVQRIETSRQAQETSLKSDHGILSFVGAYRLEEGETEVGSGVAEGIQLPAGAAPALVGKFIVSNNRVTFAASGVDVVTLSGNPVSTVELAAPNKLSVGRLELIYYPSDKEKIVFVSDPQSPNRSKFGGLDWFPINSEWKIEGRFVANPKSKKIEYENALGGTNHADSPGYVVFTRNGHEYRLEVESGAHGLTALFSDETSGKSTYGGGRSLDIERGKGDAVTLDFNQAVNKPCAVNPYTACSLSPLQNRLALQVIAGEKTPKINITRVATAPKRIR